MTIDFKNNYDTLKGDFKKDTGMDADSKPEVYIQYYQARMLAQQVDTQYSIADSLSVLCHIHRKQAMLS